MLVGLLVTLDVIVCFLLILVVLMQSGKGGVSNAFGIGGASQTIFGAGQAGNVLTRATWILGGTFLFLSFLIAYIGGSGAGRPTRSILEPAARPTSTQAPQGSGAPLPGGTGTLPGAGTTPGSVAPGAATPGAATPGSATPGSATPPAGGQ